MDHQHTHQPLELCTVVHWNTESEGGLNLKAQGRVVRLHGGKLSYKPPLIKRTSRRWNIRLTAAPHWVEILLEQGVKINTWTRRQDTWHFKAILLHRPSSLRPVWHGVSLTPIMKPKCNCLPGHCFLDPHPPTEEHMSPITVLLSQHTIKAEAQTLLLGLYLSSHSSSGKFPLK